MKQYLDQEKAKLINDFKEKKGEGRSITGLQNIWKAVTEGRGFKLLVEKDYSHRGFVNDNNEYQLSLGAPHDDHYVLTDAVNNIIEMVLKKNGEVVIFDNDTLKAYVRMALITRY